MSPTSSGFSMLVLSSDPEIQSQFKQAFKDVSVTVAKDMSALPRDMMRRSFDAVIVELKPGAQDRATTNPPNIDLARTMVITGSRTVLKRASKFMHMMVQQNSARANGKDAMSLEDYLEWKMGDFVKGMRHGSGRNLHPMLITAIERPLITRALQETKGNQIQAAELLGLNRNTLRKKIHDLHISVKRSRTAKIRET